MDSNTSSEVKLVKLLLFSCITLQFYARIILVSLRNRTAGRRRRQTSCVWQTWQGYHLWVLSWSSLNTKVSGPSQKDLFKGKWSLAKSCFKQNYCHACHTRFAVFFPLPSCCVSSLMYGRSRIYVKVKPRSTSTFTRGLSYIASISFTRVIYVRTHGEITWQWKSALRKDSRPKRVCTAEQGKVFTVLGPNRGIQFHYLAHWTGQFA